MRQKPPPEPELTEEEKEILRKHKESNPDKREVIIDSGIPYPLHVRIPDGMATHVADTHSTRVQEFPEGSHLRWPYNYLAVGESFVGDRSVGTTTALRGRLHKMKLASKCITPGVPDSEKKYRVWRVPEYAIVRKGNPGKKSLIPGKDQATAQKAKETQKTTEIQKQIDKIRNRPGWTAENFQNRLRGNLMQARRDYASLKPGDRFTYNYRLSTACMDATPDEHIAALGFVLIRGKQVNAIGQPPIYEYWRATPEEEAILLTSPNNEICQRQHQLEETWPL